MSSLTTGITDKKRRIKKNFDVLSGGVLNILSGAQETKAVGARVRYMPQANPATCAVGELNVDASNRLNICTAANTWTVVGTQT